MGLDPMLSSRSLEEITETAFCRIPDVEGLHNRRNMRKRLSLEEAYYQEPISKYLSNWKIQRIQ
jgi:hypothetical protein